MTMVERFADGVIRNSGRIIALWAVLIVLGGVMAAQITLDSNLTHLLPQDIKPVQVIQELEERSAGMHFMYLGIVRGDQATTEELKAFAEAVGPKLAASKWIRDDLAVGIDISRLSHAAALFLDPNDVAFIGKKLTNLLKAKRKKATGFSLGLDDDDDDEDDEKKKEKTATAGPFDHLVGKYQGRFQIGGKAKTSGDNMLHTLRTKTNADGSSLYYMSDNEKMLTFLFQPEFTPSELEHYPELVLDVQAAIDAARKQIAHGADIEVYVGGAYPLQYEMRDATLHDASQSALLAGIFVLLIVLFTLGFSRRVIMVFGSLLGGLVVTFGIAWLAIGTVSVITAFLVAILGGLGIDFGLYFATRYRLLVRSHPHLDAVKRAWLQTAAPSLMGAMTTAAVMIMLTFGRFRGFAELGAIATIGITVTWAAMYTLLPALVARWDTPRAGALAAAAASTTSTAPSVTIMAVPESWRTWSPAGRAAPVFAVVALLLSIAAAISAQDVKFAYTGKEMSVENQQSYVVDRKIVENYGETIDQTLVLTYDEERGRKVHRFFQDNYGKFNSISRYESLYTFLPSQQQQKAAMAEISGIQRAVKLMPGRSDDPDEQFLYTQAKRMAKAAPITANELPWYVKRIYALTDDSGKVVASLGHIVCKHWLWEVEELERFVGEVEAIRVDGKPLVTTGRAQVFLRLIHIVQKETKLFTTLGCLLILLIFWIQARSLRFALLAMLPLVIGVLWAVGTLPHIGPDGLNLSFMNLIVLPMLVGLGVAYGVHVVYAYRLVGDPLRAMRLTLRPVLGSSLTTLVGWASLLPAAMIGMRGMGKLAALGMLGVTLASLFALPAVIAIAHRYGWIKADRTHLDTVL